MVAHNWGECSAEIFCPALLFCCTLHSTSKCSAGKFLPQLPIWMYVGVIRLIAGLGGITLTPHQLVTDADLATFKDNFEARSKTKVTLKYLRSAQIL